MIDDPSQAELVARAQAGDDQAFTELIRPYYGKICIYLARLISHDDRWRDLAQETFLQAWEKLSELRCAQQFTSWLYRIATNEAMSFLRKEALRPLSDFPIRLLPPKKPVRLKGSFAPVPMSSLAALTIGEIAVDTELSSPVPAISELPGAMSLSALADRCMNEINNYHRGEASNDEYCLEIFRRAMLEGDNTAWALLVERFHEYMLGLFRRHPRREGASRLDSPENYVARAFERFWLATVHNQQLQFTTLAAALSYLRNCLNGAILDTLRTYSRSKEVALPESCFAESPAVEDQDDGQELWDIIQSLLANERERRVAYLLFHCNLKPRDIVRLCPQEFSKMQEIYHLRRNIIERLMRDSDHIRWKLDGTE